MSVSLRYANDELGNPTDKKAAVLNWRIDFYDGYKYTQNASLNEYDLLRRNARCNIGEIQICPIYPKMHHAEK